MAVPPQPERGNVSRLPEGVKGESFRTPSRPVASSRVPDAPILGDGSATVSGKSGEASPSALSSDGPTVAGRPSGEPRSQTVTLAVAVAGSTGRFAINSESSAIAQMTAAV